MGMIKPHTPNQGVRPIEDIAKEIRRTWKNVNYAAKPYLRAMESIYGWKDMYYADTAQSIVLYFLANAGTWRGEDARRIKLELKAGLRAIGYKI